MLPNQQVSVILHFVEISSYVRLKKQVSLYNEFLYMLSNIKDTSYKVKNYNNKINIFRIFTIGNTERAAFVLRCVKMGIYQNIPEFKAGDFLNY